MTLGTLRLAVAFGGVSAMLVPVLALAVRGGWRAVRRRGRGFAAVFLVGAAVAAASAQKANLRISNVTSRGFDCAWDYGGLSPASFTGGETVKLSAEIAGLDYTLLVATLPPTVTNYHVNAVTRGFPRDWMAYDVRMTMRLNNGLLSGEARRGGDGGGELPGIDGANGGDE